MSGERKRTRPTIDIPSLYREYAKETNPLVKVRIKRSIDSEVLRKRIRDCRECDLGHKRNKSVPWSGPVDGSAKMVLVGEAPGYYEDLIGLPFVGSSGKMLTHLLALAGTSRDEIAILNTICCRPPNNDDPTHEQVESCQPNFDAQLELIGGWIGVALGEYAFANVVGLPRNKVKVDEYRERVIWKRGRAWIVTYHPALALREPRFEKLIAQDLQFALGLYHSNVSAPSVDYTEVKVLGRSYEELGAVIERQGWALVDARRIGKGTQIIVTDQRVTGKPIPRELDGLTRYDIDELMRLGLAGSEDGGTGKGGYRFTREQLARIHYVKTEFGAEIVE